MGRNVNKQSRIYGPHMFTNSFLYMDNYIWQFLMFMGVCRTAYM